jgi:hypothetical protein
MKFTMNFDTRTIVDIISLNTELRESLFEIVLTEQESLEDQDEFNEDVLLNSAVPVMKNRIKDFLFRKELTNMELGILKGLININNIDYKFLIREVTS